MTRLIEKLSCCIRSNLWCGLFFMYKTIWTILVNKFTFKVNKDIRCICFLKDYNRLSPICYLYCQLNEILTTSNSDTKLNNSVENKNNKSHKGNPRSILCTSKKLEHKYLFPKTMVHNLYKDKFRRNFYTNFYLEDFLFSGKILYNV